MCLKHRLVCRSCAFSWTPKKLMYPWNEWSPRRGLRLSLADIIVIPVAMFAPEPPFQSDFQSKWLSNGVRERCFSKPETCWSCEETRGAVLDWRSQSTSCCAGGRREVGDGGVLVVTWQPQSYKQNSVLHPLQNVTLMINRVWNRNDRSEGK